MPAGDMAISGRLLGLTSPGNLFWLGLRGTATESQRLAIGINGDPITGILSGVQMGINSGGLFVNSSNYVGIGTATPSAQLSIHGNTSSWSSTSLLGITNTNATPNASLYLIAPNMTANQPHAITLGKALTQYNSMQWIYTHIANDSTDNYMNFTPYGGTVNGIGCLYLRATGNVGIGVTNPFGFFQIACTSSTSQGAAPDGGGSHGLVFTSPKTGSSIYAMAMGVDFTTGYGYINGAGNTQTQSILLQSHGGNVGIGTNNPGSTLHVVGDIRMQITYTFFLYYLSGVNHAAISTNSSGDMLFSTGTVGVATRMTIDSNGNVGIGKDPGSKLDVAGAINCTSFLVNGTAVATGTGSVWGVNGSSAYYTSGNVGIGTISPTASLHINNASGNRLNMLYLSSIQSGIVLDSTASSNGRSYNIWSTNGSDSVGSGCLAFFDIISSTYRMIINPSGNVGIGTNNPAFTLTVYGGAGIGYNAGGNNPYISSPTLTIQNTANYGAVCAWFERDVIAGGAIGTFSDIRIKNNIKPAINLLDKINQITIVSHGFIDPFKTPSETSIAVIAQDIINVIPDAVMFNKEVIPNIMQVPISCILLDDIVVITCSNSMDINVNDTVQLILASGNKDCTVSYISDDRKIIYVPKWDNINLLNDQIFIYGKYVNDFHIVDKPKLGLLALGGVKELHQIIKEQQTQINQLIHRLAAANIA
jgi:hypothetical protein